MRLMTPRHAGTWSFSVAATPMTSCQELLASLHRCLHKSRQGCQVVGSPPLTSTWIFILYYGGTHIPLLRDMIDMRYTNALVRTYVSV